MNALRLSTIPLYSISDLSPERFTYQASIYPYYMILYFPLRSPQLSFLFLPFCTLIHFTSSVLLNSPLLFSLQPPFLCLNARAAPSPISLSLLLFFSMRRWRFSSRRRASSTSWCCRHLWKFSTTTPTNMLSTKKLTIRRKEMK